MGSLLSIGIQFRVESGNPRAGLHLSYVVGVAALSFPGIYDLQAPYLKEWPPTGGPEVLLLASCGGFLWGVCKCLILNRGQKI